MTDNPGQFNDQDVVGIRQYDETYVICRMDAGILVSIQGHQGRFNREETLRRFEALRVGCDTFIIESVSVVQLIDPRSEE